LLLILLEDYARSHRQVLEKLQAEQEFWELQFETEKD